MYNKRQRYDIILFKDSIQPAWQLACNVPQFGSKANLRRGMAHTIWQRIRTSLGFRLASSGFGRWAFGPERWGPETKFKVSTRKVWPTYCSSGMEELALEPGEYSHIVLEGARRTNRMRSGPPAAPGYEGPRSDLWDGGGNTVL